VRDTPPTVSLPADQPEPDLHSNIRAASLESSEVANAAAATADVSSGTEAGPRGLAAPQSSGAFEPTSQPRIEFSSLPIQEGEGLVEEPDRESPLRGNTARDLEAIMRDAVAADPGIDRRQDQLSEPPALAGGADRRQEQVAGAGVSSVPPESAGGTRNQLPPLNSAEKFTREVAVESLSNDIRPLGQLDESFIIATDNDGLLLIDQHVAHERILFDKYRALESTRLVESQHLLIPETFDLTPAQAFVFETIASELENYGFELMRLSGRTVAIKATPADLPAGEARNMLAELLDTVDAEKKGSARETLRDDIAASLACHAAIKVNMPLSPEKMRWLIDRLLKTSSPTTC